MKKTVIILAVVAACCVLVCALLFTGVIDLSACAKQEAQTSAAPSQTDAAGTADTSDALSSDEPTLVPTAEPEGFEQQLDNFLNGLKTSNAQLIVSVYHEAYWTAGGQTLADAYELMGENLAELAMPSDLNWTIDSVTEADADTMASVRSNYASYGIDGSRITEGKLVTVTTHGTVNGADEVHVLDCHFIKIDEGWYLFDDIFQLFY